MRQFFVCIICFFYTETASSFSNENLMAEMCNQLESQVMVVNASHLPGNSLKNNLANKEKDIYTRCSKKNYYLRNNLDFLTYLKDYLIEFNSLPALIQYLNNYNKDLIYYNWDLYESQLYNPVASSFAKPINKAEKVILLQDQSDNLSLIFENVSNANLQIESVSFFKVRGESLLYDSKVRVVKSWYMGTKSSDHLKPTKYQLENPVLVPELIVYNDNLVIAKDDKNLLKIDKISNDSSYIDVSSPTILMPDSAKSYDSSVLKVNTIAPYMTKMFFINFKTTTVASGYATYNIQIKYKKNGEMKKFNAAIEIQVLPIHLSKSKKEFGLFYAGQLSNKWGLKARLKSEQQYENELMDIKLHGVNYPTQYLGGETESSIEYYITTRNKLGFPCDKYYFVNGIADAGNNKSNFESSINMLKKIITSQTNCNSPQIYFYGTDGAIGRQLLDQKDSWEKIHDAGGYIFASSFRNNSIFNLVGNTLDTLLYSKISDSSNVVKEFHSSNKNILLYGNPQSGVPIPYLYRKNYGFYLVKSDFDGAFPFAYQISFPDTYSYDTGILNNRICLTSRSGYCSAWNNFDSALFYDHMFTYPTSNGVIDTIQWEGYAAAITDTRYYYTLIDLMKKRCTKNDARCNFDPMSLIDVDDPAGTRQRIIDKIKILLKLD